jgi:hypothetical protein
VVNLERVRFLSELSPCLAGSNQPCRYQGKTAYLYLKIIESLIAGSPFLYQTKERTVHHVNQEGVVAIRSPWLAKTHIVAFVDGDKGDGEPHHFLDHSLVQIVVASSPRGAYRKWYKQSGNTTSFTRLATRLWAPHELFLTGLVLAFLLSTLD